MRDTVYFTLPTSDKNQTIKLDFKKKALFGDFTNATKITLAATEKRLENSISQPNAVAPETESITLQENSFQIIESQANTFQIYILNVK